eukprot:EG_transcript_1396
MATLKVRVIQARDLPVMDRRSQLADAYVEIRFNEHAERTPVCRNTLTPTWNHMWTLKVPSLQTLQEDPVEFKVYDYDIFSRDDLIGIVLIDLNIILSDPTGKCHMPTSWVPIFDTMRGLRGELELSIRIRFADQRNPFCPPLLASPTEHAMPPAISGTADTGEGVLIFSLSALDPTVYRIEKVAGMVEELLGKADPEHQTLQNFRTSRTTNDARMLQFFRLSGKVRRQLGRKVLEIGCNCVLGYNEQFDLERNNGIIIRAYGTACIISAVCPSDSSKAQPTNVAISSPRPFAVDRQAKAYKLVPSLLLPGTKTQMRNLHGVTRTDVQLMTLQSLGRHAIRRLGGCVSARAVKVITSARSKEELMQERDSWWLEIRDEIKMNARAMRCNAVIAYAECVALYEDLCILSASGTAALLESAALGFAMDEKKARKEEKRQRRADRQSCRLVHRPTTFSKHGENCDICHVCRRKYVPEILVATCEVPEELAVNGAPQLIEARVGRLKKKETGEALAQSISVELPWLESKMHTQLIAKLKSNKLNAAFGLRVDFVTGDNHIIVTAAATGVCLPALPQPVALPRFITEDPRDVRPQSNALAETEAAPKEAHGTSGPGEGLDSEHAEGTLLTPAQETSEGDTATCTVVHVPHQSGERELLTFLNNDNGPPAPSPAGAPSRPAHSNPSTLSTSSSSSTSTESDSETDSLSSSSTSDEEKKSRLEEGQPARTKESEFVIEVDDDDDPAMYREDVDFPANQCICNVEDVGQAVHQQYVVVRHLMLQRRYKMPPTAQPPNLWINRCFSDIRQVLQFKLSGIGNCAVMRYRAETTITEENELNLILTGMLMQPLPGRPPEPASTPALLPPAHRPSLEGTAPSVPADPNAASSSASALGGPPGPVAAIPHDPLQRPPDGKSLPVVPRIAIRAPEPPSTNNSPLHIALSGTPPLGRPPLGERRGASGLYCRPTLPPFAPGPFATPIDPADPYKSTRATTLDSNGRSILLTRLSYVPGATIDRYLGRISQHFLREAMYISNPSEGGVGAFTHSVHVEANCIIHRLVAAAGGDALLDYNCHHHVIDDNDDKSTAYQFITILGQVVTLKWPTPGGDPAA